MDTKLQLRTYRRWDGLTADAVALLTSAREDPFAIPLLVSPSTAHARAVGQAVADEVGVAAGLQGKTASALRRELSQSLLDMDPQVDPWSGSALTLRIFDLLRPDDPNMTAVSEHVQACRVRGIAHADWTTAQQFSAVLQSLIRHSPAVLEQWRAGEDVDAEGSALPWDKAWWPHVWRLLHDDGHPDPMTQLTQLCSALGAAPLRWPSCVWISPAAPEWQDYSLAQALSRRIPVTVLHLLPACAERSRWEPFNSVREHTSLRWHECVQQCEGQAHDHCDHADPETSTGAAEVEVHLCHGEDRQAEVCAEAVCAALQEFPDIEPRDVAITTSTHAPQAHLLSAFAYAAESDGTSRTNPLAQCRISGARSHLPPNPVIQAVCTVLRLSRTRQTAGELLDLCTMPAIAARFGFTADDQVTIRRLVMDSGIRWGLDAQSRSRVGLGEIRQSTWFAGIERLLLGVAMSDDPPSHIDTVTAVGDIGSPTVPLVGALAELVSRVRHAMVLTATSATMQQWVDRLTTLIDNLTSPPAEMPWARQAATGQINVLARVAPHCKVDAMIIADLLDEQSSTRPRRPSWFNGDCHISDPAELDGISHDVVVLVDPDEDEIGADPLRGLRDPADPLSDPMALRHQYLFDAVATARRKVVVVAQKMDPVTNSEVDLGPFVSTLRDNGLPRRHESSDGVESPDGVVLISHGLQPFSPHEFADQSGQSWRSFDVVMAEVQLNAQQDVERSSLLPRPNDPPAQIYSCADVSTALSNPARTVLRARIGAPAAKRTDDVVEELPLDLTGLDRYQIRARLLADLTHGSDIGTATAAERLRGTTPPGVLGLESLNRAGEEALSIVDREATLVAGASRQVIDVNLELTDGDVPHLPWVDSHLTDPYRPLLLTDRIEAHGVTIVRMSPANLSPRTLLETWLRLLAVAVAQPDVTGWRAAVVTRSANPEILVAPDAQQARNILAGLVRVAWWSSQQLFPMPARTAAALTEVILPYRPNRWVTPAQAGWKEDHDSNWSPFASADYSDLERLCRQHCEASPLDLARWLMTPITTARTRGRRSR